MSMSLRKRLAEACYISIIARDPEKAWAKLDDAAKDIFYRRADAVLCLMEEWALDPDSQAMRTLYEDDNWDLRGPRWGALTFIKTCREKTHG